MASWIRCCASALSAPELAASGCCSIRSACAGERRVVKATSNAAADSATTGCVRSAQRSPGSSPDGALSRSAHEIGTVRDAIDAYLSPSSIDQRALARLHATFKEAAGGGAGPAQQHHTNVLEGLPNLCFKSSSPTTWPSGEIEIWPEMNNHPLGAIDSPGLREPELILSRTRAAGFSVEAAVGRRP